MSLVTGLIMLGLAFLSWPLTTLVLIYLDLDDSDWSDFG
jgi:hypothetical protein